MNSDREQHMQKEGQEKKKNSSLLEKAETKFCESPSASLVSEKAINQELEQYALSRWKKEMDGKSRRDIINGRKRRL